MDRANIQPIVEKIPAARQKDARHYGVHPYFTRRPANVVRAYIERYSQQGDVVLDPFGGTGVTAIEAFLCGRHAIHNDLNPFPNFIARTIVDTALPSTLPLYQAFERTEQACAGPLREIEQEEGAAQRWLKKLPLPDNIRLPRNSDASFFYEMFTPRQLAGLALLKEAIEREPKGIVRDLLLLAWSASVAKLNKTFLSTKGRAASRGGSSIFSIYRYKLASQSVELPIWETFSGRFANVVAAKKEIFLCRDYVRKQSGGLRDLDSQRDFRVLALDAATLDGVIEPGSVDYIFTDPPYGAFISYLDLSLLWNHWLGFPVSQESHQRETIVGGECRHTEDHYRDSLARAIRTCVRLLRPDRWFSVVFQHWDLSYFATILETANDSGAELKTAITQTGDVVWSMHKKKNSKSVLAGEMIITFYKPGIPRGSITSGKCPGQQKTRVSLADVLDVCLGNSKDSFTSEALYNRLVLELWRQRALDCLAIDRRAFAEHLEQRGWVYDARKHLWCRGIDSKATQDEPILFPT